MHKDELIQLHALLWQIRSHIETTVPNGSFKEYEEFGVIPSHIHKSKSQHKKAVFLLGKGLAQMLDLDDSNGNVITPSIIPRLSERMDNIAKKSTKEEKQSIHV